MVALAVLTIAVASIGVIVRSSDEDKNAAQDEAAKPDIAATSVTSSGVGLRDWPVAVIANGSIYAWQEASVGTLVGGLRIVSIDADVGDAVKKGQPLAHFDLETVRAQVVASSADLQGAQAAAARSIADAERANRLGVDGAISQQDLIQYRTQAATARAQVASAEAHLELQDLQLRQAVVVAPDDGVISTRAATLGAVEPAGQELFRLIRRGRLQWQAEVQAENMSSVRTGQAVQLCLPDGTRASGLVSHVSPGMNAQSRLGIVFVDINAGSSARAGMFASGSIELPGRPARVVPAASIVFRDGHDTVAVLEAKEGNVLKVSMRRIVVGRRNGDEVEVLEGLKDNDRVVVRGAGFLGDGDTVKLSEAVPVSSTKAKRS